MLFAVLPPIGRTIGLPDWAVGSIFSLSAVLWVITSPIWGRTSDRIGRKPLIVLGLSAYALSMLLFAGIVVIAVNFHWHWISAFVALALARCLFGAGGSATNPAAQALVADVTAPAFRTREIAALTSAFAFGSAAGPALAAFMVAKLGLTAPLIVVGILATISAISAHFFLPTTVVPEERRMRQKGPSVWVLGFDKRVRPFLIFGLGLSASTAVMMQMISFFFIDRLQMAPKDAAELVAAALSAGAMATIVAQLGLLPRLRLTPRGLMTLGALGLAIGATITAFATSFGELAFAQIIMGLAGGLARPGFTGGASLAVTPEEQGGIAGLIVSVNGAGFVLAPIFGAGVYAWFGPSAPFELAAVVLCAIGLYALVGRSLRDAPLVEPPADDVP